MESSRPENPLASWWSDFSARTPLLTRCTLQILAATWITSLFTDFTYSLVNVPYYSIGKLELYRLVLSPMFGNSLFSLVVIGLTLTPYGSRLEFSMGSTHLGVVLAVMSLATNLIFVFVCYLMASLGSYEALFFQCQGFWPVLMALIVVESQSSPESTRRLFVVEVPLKYYPLALYALFSMFTGPRLDMAIAMGVGYLNAQGRLAACKPTPQQVAAWESGCLANLTSHQNFILGSSAQGSSAWSPSPTPERAQEGGMASSLAGMLRMGNSAPGSSAEATADAPSTEGSSNADNFAGAGRTLGGAGAHTDRSSPRAAMLAAAEARGRGAAPRGETFV